MKRIVFLILILIIVLSACSQTTVEEEDAEIELSKVIQRLPEETALIEFLDNVYNISDPSKFELDIELMLKNTSKENVEYLENVDYLGYDKLCTEDGLKGIFANRLQSYYGNVALAKNFKMLISQLTYVKTFDKEAEGTILNEFRTIGYEYSAQLLLEYNDGKSEEIIEEGYVNVKLIDGEWKVSLFRLKEFKDFWKDVRTHQ